MTPYPDNIRKFVTQESVRLGDSGYDVEVEIVPRADVDIVEHEGEEVVSVGLREYCPLPPMEADDLLVVFDLGTVLDIDDVRFADPESGARLPVKTIRPEPQQGPVRVPTVVKADARISLLLWTDKHPFGTLTVSIQRDGTLASGTFSPQADTF